MASYRLRLIALLRTCTVLSLLASTNSWSMAVSPSWSIDGSYTVSWPWYPTGCVTTYSYPYYMTECYWVEERLNGGNWVAAPVPDNVMSWNATGKSAGTYEYRLVYSYDDCCSGGGYQYVVDGPVTVQVGVPPIPLSEAQEYASRHGDVDGDGDIDLYVKRILGTSWQLPIAELLLRRNPNGTFNVETSVSQATRNIVNGWGMSLTKPQLVDFNADGYMDLLIQGLSPANVGPYDVVVFAATGPGAPAPSARLVDESIKKFFTDIVGYLNDPNYFNGAYQTQCNLYWTTAPGWRWDIDYYQHYYYFPIPYVSCEQTFNPNYSATAAATGFAISLILNGGEFVEGSYAQSTVTYELGQLFGTQYVGTSFLPADAYDLETLGNGMQMAGIGLLRARRAARIAGTFLQYFRLTGPLPPGAYHSYAFGTNICHTSTPGCTVDAIFAEVRKYPVKGHAAPQAGMPDPCAGKPRSRCDVLVQTDDLTMVDVFEWSNDRDNVGPVRHVVEPEVYRVTNITQEGHLFHPGTVERWVYVTTDGYVRVGTYGNGYGDYPDLNESVGASVFKQIDNEIKAKVMDALGSP